MVNETAEQAMTRTRAEFFQSLASQIDPDTDGSEYTPHGFDYVVIGSEIKVAGEWVRVTAKRTVPMRLLQLEPEGLPRYWYEVTDGETWLIADPF